MSILHRSLVRVKALYLVGAFLLILPTIFPGNSYFPTPKLPDTSIEPSKDLFASLPLQFVKNLEHETGKEAYPWAAVGGGLLLAPGRLIYHLVEPAEAPSSIEMFQEPPKQPTIDLEIEWLGANPHSSLGGMDRLSGKVNIFAGENPSEWRTGLPSYAGVRMRSLYPGIELTFVGSEGKLKSQYSVRAHADPSLIHWRYPEGTELNIDAETGDLQAFRESRLLLVEKAPEAWQMVDGKRRLVQVSYSVTDNEAFFTVDSYDPDRDLVIDPVVEFSTYIGGGTFASGDDVAVDADGYIYIAGRTSDDKFYVAKINQLTKTFIYTALIEASGYGVVNALAVDEFGNAYITGVTDSTIYPTQNHIQTDCPNSDVYVTKIKPDGSGLLFSTYLCGNGYEGGESIAVDTEQKVYITGNTGSSDFPVTEGAYDKSLGGTQDGFIAILDTIQPSLIYVTFWGGSQGENLYHIELDDAGNLYVLGGSNSSDYPIFNPISSFHGGSCWYGTCYDAVLTKLTHTGSTMIYSTFLGGTGSDVGNNLDVNSSGIVFLVGFTDSNDLPLLNPYQSINYQGGGPGWGGEIFLMIINSTGTGLLYSTYFGGPGDDAPADITLLEGSNSFMIAGSSTECLPPFSFKKVSNTFGFVTQFDITGWPNYFRLIGGYSFGYPRSMAVDDQYGVYVVGSTNATDFPLVNPFSTMISNTFLVKLAQQSPPRQPTPNDIFLPVVMKYTALGLFGWVTEHGCGVADIPLELRFYNGYSWMTVAKTTTAADGKYNFPNLPSLNPGEYYYVRYENLTNPDRLWMWGTPILLSYEAGQNVFLSVFDITEVSLDSPADGASISLPYNFHWWLRPMMPGDSYDLNLVEYYGNDFWYTSPLGFVSSYTMNSLPTGFITGEPQFWYVGIHSQDGGYGETYDAHLVFFQNSGSSSITSQFIPELDRKERLDQIEGRRLKEVEEKQHTP